MTAQMNKGKYIAKVPSETNPIIEHGLHDFFVSSVTVQTVAASDDDHTTVEERTVASPPYKVLDRDRIQLTLADSDDERWIIVQA